VVYVDKVEANIGVRITSVIGGRNPAHATGVGKALLAELLPDDAAVRAWAQRHGPLQARTARTATSATMLSKSLNDVRTFGWAVDDEESEDGLLCVAARVPLVFGVLAPRVAVSVTGLRSRMVQYGIERTGRELVALIDRFEFHARDGVEPAQPQEGR
jgi:IclR family acetate operon transcriptional repressor